MYIEYNNKMFLLYILYIIQALNKLCSMRVQIHFNKCITQETDIHTCT